MRNRPLCSLHTHLHIVLGAALRQQPCKVGYQKVRAVSRQHSEANRCKLPLQQLPLLLQHSAQAAVEGLLAVQAICHGSLWRGGWRGRGGHVVLCMCWRLVKSSQEWGTHNRRWIHHASWQAGVAAHRASYLPASEQLQKLLHQSTCRLLGTVKVMN